MCIQYTCLVWKFILKYPKQNSSDIYSPFTLQFCVNSACFLFIPSFHQSLHVIHGNAQGIGQLWRIGLRTRLPAAYIEIDWNNKITTQDIFNLMPYKGKLQFIKHYVIVNILCIEYFVYIYYKSNKLIIIVSRSSHPPEESIGATASGQRTGGQGEGKWLQREHIRSVTKGDAIIILKDINCSMYLNHFIINTEI